MKTNRPRLPAEASPTPSHIPKAVPSATREPGTGATLSRRRFIAAGTAATAFMIVPRPVLGGSGYVPPSEKITLAHIGCGSEGLREMPELLDLPEVQIVAVCDPVKDSQDYVDWSKDGLRSSLARTMGNPGWRQGQPGIPGGRDVAKELIETVYAKRSGAGKFRGVNSYIDFRELLEKEKDVNAVKIMTPDHLHATIAVAALRKGKHAIMHKPLANRLKEARLVIETAQQTKLATHFMPASDGANIKRIKSWIDAGAIGTLQEIHNWSNRPVWPQYPMLPTEMPAVPNDFDWQLWLGPCLDRPYHPHYTHAVFRGWYEFGGGALADMGHYSLWPVFQLFDLEAPYAVESTPGHLCRLDGHVAVKIHNDYSFPAACTIRFRFAAKGPRPALDLFWYDGSMKPRLVEELEAANQEFAAEGMMFVGDKGKILAEFRGENPRLLSGAEHAISSMAGEAAQAHRDATPWLTAFRGGPASYGDFLLAGPISDAFNLGAISLRLGGKRLLFDAAQVRITNSEEANRLMTRDYRKGWELA